MNLKSMMFLQFVTFLVILKYSSATLLSESSQIVLESSDQLLPSQKETIKVKEQLRAIRYLYPAVATIFHDADWVPGEVVTQRDELNNNIGVIRAINESQYGPLLPVVSSANTDNSLNEVVLSFEKPYHAIVFSKILEKKFNVTSRPNFINYDIRNQISYVNSYPTYSTYTIKKSWRHVGMEKVYAHFWQFTVAPADTLTVTLEKEYGDEL